MSDVYLRNLPGGNNMRIRVEHKVDELPAKKLPAQVPQDDAVDVCVGQAVTVWELRSSVT